MARLQRVLREDGRPEAHAGARAQESVMQVPRSPRSRSTWAWARPWPTEGHGRRRGRPHQDHRPEAGVTQVEEVDRGVQDPRGPADRLQGDAARRAHVRVPRPPGHVAMPRIRDFRGVSTRARSTAAATSASASRNRSFSPRSSTTRSTSSGAWTSRSRRRRRTTSRAGRCSRPSISRSASKEPRVWPRQTWSSARSAAPRS